MSIDELQHNITWEGFQRGKLVLHGSVLLRDLSTVAIAPGKAGGRLVLVQKDGTANLPLGATYVVGEPAQFILLKEIQYLISTSP